MGKMLFKFSGKGEYAEELRVNNNRFSPEYIIKSLRSAWLKHIFHDDYGFIGLFSPKKKSFLRRLTKHAKFIGYVITDAKNSTTAADTSTFQRCLSAITGTPQSHKTLYSSPTDMKR